MSQTNFFFSSSMHALIDFCVSYCGTYETLAKLVEQMGNHETHGQLILTCVHTPKIANPPPK